MGSGSSRLGSRPSRPQVNRRRRRVASYLCGSSQSHQHAPDEMEDSLCEMSDGSVRQRTSVADDNLRGSVKEPSSHFSSENVCSSSPGVSEASRRHSNEILAEESSKEFGSRSHATSGPPKCLSESRESIPFQSDKDPNAVDSACTSKDRQSLLYTNGDSRHDAVDNCRNEESFQLSTNSPCSSSISLQELGSSHANGVSSVQNDNNGNLEIHNSDLSSIPAVADSSLSSGSSGLIEHEPLREAPPPASSGIHFPSTGQIDDRNESLLHVDVVSISSATLPTTHEDTSSNEARRNSRRLFWDAFSRRSSRRNSGSPTIIFSTEDPDDLGSHNRWLLDFSSDLFDNGLGDLGYQSGNYSSYERRWHSRSEIWERLNSGLDGHRRRTAFCASGLHPDGTCSCETFIMSDELGTRASISRIVMLAEALFEVLDEIHRQPIPLSFSMVSMPAPDTVVDSFPLKCHHRSNLPEGDEEQCYICLAEYEEGDKIRVLPCRHEYHMSCVDKWLKEIHGVCPLCRRNVSEGITVGSCSNS